MPEEQFALMRSILAAPSPVGLEGAMTYGVLKPHLASFAPSSWQLHQFRGNAGVVLDTHPGRDDMFSVMIVGHADKIRMQVRHIGDDGKIWINSDSFLPTTLIGHEAVLFSADPKAPSRYRMLEGGTVEAIGAIHFAPPGLRNGTKGIKPEMLYLELQIHGEKGKKQVERLGIRPGDPVLLKRPIRRGFSPDSFYGAFLDNGLGCFAAAEVARLVAEQGCLDKVRTLFAFASHEEIGRMGSRVMAGSLKPDVLIAADVGHDYAAAPGTSDKRYPPLAMGKGFIVDVGSVVSQPLTALIEQVAMDLDIPLQRDVVGRDTGTDAMAAAFAAIDAAVASVAFPIRNMHTISETGHTGDVLACIHCLHGLLNRMVAMNDGQGMSAQDLRQGHVRLDKASPLLWKGKDEEKEEGAEE